MLWWKFCGVVKMSNSVTAGIFLLFLCLVDAAKFQYSYVTCGSVLKLKNSKYGTRLHSHDVKYGSGSGQQSVTAVDSSEDHNSYWRIQGKESSPCTRGEPVECGQTIRLTHVSTGRNLHSHHFQSPLSHNLEVSAFGEGGIGDDGDNWSVVCSGKYWDREEKIRIKHLVTDSYLHVTGDTYGRPIHGQREVSGYPAMNEQNYWQAAEGIFVKPTEEMSGGPIHDEF